MKNLFIFHAIGQGLFYTGSLLDGHYNFIYDCGTLSKANYLQQAIDYYKTKLLINKPLDFLMISHLDADHVSGITHLKSTLCIKRFIYRTWEMVH